MKYQILAVTLNDDTWWALGADSQLFIDTALGLDLHQRCLDQGMFFSLEFLDRDWNNQCQTIKLWIDCTERQLFWFKLQWTPPIFE